ncbi:MAG: ABC transporter ATP-binding protein [Dehalococcoidales bacterium]|jgi:branched-chain amino acid transport system ATP-binding protein
MLLNVKNIRVNYSKAEAVRGVSIEVPEGCVVGIIGANGAGKSTILKAIVGTVPITHGEIWFSDKKINNLKTHKIVELGLVHIPEGRHLFPYMSVLANLKLGAYLRKDKAAIKKDLNVVFERFPRLYERREQQASTLSGGEQQMLAIGRGLMAKPKLLLLDEPSLGLAPMVVQELACIISDINKSGISILLVEQNAGLATKVTDMGYVLEVGKIVLEGKLKEIMGNEIVKRAFLG